MSDDLFKIAEDSTRNGFFLAFGSAVATAVLAVGSIVAGRLLGPELYGQYTLILVVPSLLFLFTDLGVNQGIIKFISNMRVKGQTSKIANIIYSGLFLRIAIGVVLSVVLYVFAEPFAVLFVNRADLYPYLQIMAFVVLFQAIYSTTVSAFISMDKSEYSAVTQCIDAVIKTSMSIILILLGLNLFGAVAGNVVGFVIAGICGVILMRFMLPKSKMKLTADGFKVNTRSLISYGSPLYASFLLMGIVPLFQNMILANFTTDFDVGNFKAASNFAALMTVLSIPITNALLSAFSKLDSSKENKVKTFFKLSNKYTALIIFPITFLFIVFSTEIIQVVYGSTYQSAPLFLSLYCLLYFLVALGYLNLSSFFNGLGDTKATMKIALITFGLVAALSPLFTQAYSVVGLIIALLIANTAGISYGAYFARKKYQVQFDLPGTTKIFVVSLLCVVPLLAVRFAVLPVYFTLALGVFGYLVAYLTLLPLTRIVTPTELKMINGVLQKIQFLKVVGKLTVKYELKLCQTRVIMKNKLEALF
ncbi:MAG: oligosaccharide flippase family protein [Candidatus Bathyarchaeia archaeon]|jgi:O-antigen/teichoic acid export membrane protein